MFLRLPLPLLPPLSLHTTHSRHCHFTPHIQDIYSLFHLQRPFKFISKTSNFLIPIVGWSMFLTGWCCLVCLGGWLVGVGYVGWLGVLVGWLVVELSWGVFSV